MPYRMSLPVGDKVTFPRDSEIMVTGRWSAQPSPSLSGHVPSSTQSQLITALSSMALDPLQARGRVLQSNINQ